MTTLRRVLLQSAREAGPSDVPAATTPAAAPPVATSSRPVTPHTKSSATPRRPSPPIEEEPAKSDGESSNGANDDRDKRSVGKKRRISRGWDDAGKEGEVPSGGRTPKAANARENKERDADKIEALLKSPKLPTRSSATPKSPRATAATEPPSTSTKSKNVEQPSIKSVDSSSNSSSSSSPAQSIAVAPDNVVPSASSASSAPSTMTKEKASASVTRTPSPPKEAIPKPEVIATKQVAVATAGSTTSTANLAAHSTNAGKQQQQQQPQVNGAKPKMSSTNAVIALEWVQCEGCRKWRKLPLNISSSSLPETWVCEMNTWNSAYASCSAELEEGSEESTEDASGNATEGGANGGKVTEKRSSVLPLGINLYGGQPQSQQIVVGPNGQKTARVVSYRDLIAAHYRNHRNFNPLFNATCDSRYIQFSAYQSGSLKPRAFDANRLAFATMGWDNGMSGGVVSNLANVNVPMSNGLAHARNGEANGGVGLASRPLSSLPPKKKLRPAD